MAASKFMKHGFLACGLLLLSACGTTYSIVGNFDQTGEPFYGEMDLSANMNRLGLGGMESGVVKFSIKGGKVICEGDSDLIKSVGRRTKMGLQRRSILTCSDGRRFKVETVQSSASGGHGQGVSNKGDVIRFQYDESPRLAQSRMNVQRINRMVK